MTERILYFDCFSGIAGDMTLGALLDLGADEAGLRSALKTLPLTDWSLEVNVDRRGGLRGLDVQVWVSGEKEGPAATIHSEGSGPDHAHGHMAAHHEDVSQHNHGDHDHVGHRHYADVVSIIEGGDLPKTVVKEALAAFRILAAAEAHVHGVEVEDVHFHEVGAVDSIIDIVGVAWCIWNLGVTRIECAPIPLGRGFIKCAHGRMPLPAPATLEITRGLEVVDAGIERELVTPTGAAFIKAWAKKMGSIPAMRVHRVGWGFGDAEFPDRPNALRLILGEGVAVEESMFVLETNIDDTTPELAGFLLDRLLESGAKDAWIIPVHMKKNRPGFTISALVDTAKRLPVENVMLTESSAIGLRYYPVERTCLERASHQVETPWGPVGVKTGMRAGHIVNVAPEFDDCAQLARSTGIPLKTIYQHAITAYFSDDGDDDGSL
jgi:uncharacterized protein (TIGR00299 family) protein